MFATALRRRVPMALATALILILASAAWVFTAGSSSAVVSSKSFNLAPEKKFASCFTAAGHTAAVHVQVTRGANNDTLTMSLSGFKPNLAFDMFTVQRSNLLSTGALNPSFTNFGLAWYQSDVHVDSNGNGSVTIRTILLDQIFGFDPAVSLLPTNTFHVGIWFNDPKAAGPCGFTGVTPFNGEHRAGPAAFISTPNATTNLGPLCTNPNTSTTPPSCNP